MVRPYPAIILAAGASQRLGQPKSLVKIGTTTLVGLAQEKLIAAGCSPIVVVTRSELLYDVMKATIGATVVANATPENGRTGSLQCGLLSLAGDTGRLPRGVIVAPVDRPGWAVKHVRSLLAASSRARSGSGRLGVRTRLWRIPRWRRPPRRFWRAARGLGAFPTSLRP